MLKVSHVTKRYGKVIACNDVDFELADKKKKFGDEPMIGLDPHAIKELKAMIEQMLVFMAMGAAGLCLAAFAINAVLGLLFFGLSPLFLGPCGD